MKLAALRSRREESNQAPYLIRWHEAADAQDRNLGKGVLAGLIGGLVGTIVMTQFQNAWSKASEALEAGNSAQGSQAEQKQQGEPEREDATMKAAGKIAQLGGRQLSHDQKKKLGPVMHYSFGTLQGALYGSVIELTGTAGGFLPGLIFGAALFTVADEIAVPALGLSGKPTESPISSHLYGLAAHWIAMAQETYNYDTFRRHMMQEDMHFRGGPEPGQLAPDFDLPTISGTRVRLGELRGKRPVLLEFGSIT